MSGTIMMLLMRAAEWPLDRFTDGGEPTMSTNPILGYHLIHTLVLIGLAGEVTGEATHRNGPARASSTTRRDTGRDHR